MRGWKQLLARPKKRSKIVVMENRIREIIGASITTKQLLLNDTDLLQTLIAVTGKLITVFQQGGKALFCGNGGSAGDAQHIAAELSGRFYRDRAPLFAEALHVNTSYLTAVANDYGYEEVFARLTRAMGRPGDILVGFSTSGNSTNVLRALQAARDIGMITVGLTGRGGGQMAAHCDHLIDVPSSETPRIQECHILVGHIICELVESQLFDPKPAL